jgi:Alba
MDETDEKVATIVVKHHAKISKVVTKGLSILIGDKEEDSPQNTTLRIEADARAAAKAITIVEIIKRRLAVHGKEVVQSNEVREKPASVEVPVEEPAKTHLQGEGYESENKKAVAQLVMHLKLKSNV